MVILHFFLIYYFFSLSALVVSARGLDIDLNEAAIEEVDQPKRPFLPTKKEDAARIALEKKRKRQREYKKRIDNDPIRRAAFLSKQRAQQKEYRKNLSKKQKEHRSEKIRSAYFKRKNDKNQGFSSQIQKERHRIISLEKEKKASPEELAFLAKIRAGDRKRKRKQLERESEKAKKND